MLSDKDFDLLCEACDLQDVTLQKPNCWKIDSVAESKFSVLTEYELTELLLARSDRDRVSLNFLSAGAFNHFLPAIFKVEKQRIDFNLMQPDKALNIENANIVKEVENHLSKLYAAVNWHVSTDDFITLLVRLLIFIQQDFIQHKQNAVSKVLIPATIAPVIRQALRSQLKFHNIDLVIVDYDKNTGQISRQQLAQFNDQDILAIVLGYPNYFGILEDLSEVLPWARSHDCPLIGLTTPLSLSILESPVNITYDAFDYLLGDLQGVGLIENQTGIAASFLATKHHVSGLQIKSICSQKNNSKLSYINAYLSLLGLSGLQKSVRMANDTLHQLVESLTSIDGVSKRFSASAINEFVIKLDQIDVEKALKILSGHNMIFGFLLQDDYPELENSVLISCTDQHTQRDIEKLVKKVEIVFKNLSTAGCPVKPKFNV